MTAKTMPLADVTHDAIRILCKELGIANTMRFVGQFTTGYGNYAEEREQLFAGMTLDDIVSQIKHDQVSGHRPPAT